MIDRRRFLAACTAAGLAAPLGEALLAQTRSSNAASGAATGGAAEGGAAAGAPPLAVTTADMARAEALAGLSFTDEERQLALAGVNEQLAEYAALREIPLPNPVLPALRFDPLLPGAKPPAGESRFEPSPSAARRPADGDDLAFLPLTDLAHLLRTRQVSSEELTRLYLERLARYDPLLHCVVSRTEERALFEARQADREIAAGRYRGLLHGVPWGAKDLLSARGARTTWGARPYREQVIDEDATVVARLTEAGAVLAAKLTLGALAWGDVWFGGKTRNPWNPEQGSSGSSAGSAAAVVAGLAAFTIGSETLGSIVSPSTRCGATGLRPTFGRVSRYGAMTLSWSMDKLGPICRSAEDCAAVFQAIHGPDGLDPTVRDAPFRWEPKRDPRKIRVGYHPAHFEAPETNESNGGDAAAEAREIHTFDAQALAVLRDIGIEPVPIELPTLPASPLSLILSVEAAAAFDELTRSGLDDELVRQVERAWPNTFRQARYIPAVEYIQANRARTLLMQQMAEALESIDAYIAPPFAGQNLLVTNLTGHPAVVLPHGFKKDGTPASITFVGKLYGESEILALAHAFQEATDFHRRRPELGGVGAGT